MPERSTLPSKNQIGGLSGIARSVSLVTAFAAIVSYQIVVGFPDAVLMLSTSFPALAVGLLVGFLVSLPFADRMAGGTAAGFVTGSIVAALTSITFISIAKFGFGFGGSLTKLAATIAIPGIAAGSVWALLLSRAQFSAEGAKQDLRRPQGTE